MTDDGIARLFGAITAFSWDEAKRRSNLRKHRIDFKDIESVFDAPALILRSDRHGEIRYQVFGYLNGEEVAIACTLRDDTEKECRIVSARPAHRSERRKHYGRSER